VPDAGPRGARDDGQLLCGHGRADQDDHRDACHRRVQARRDVQVADGDLGTGSSEGPDLAWVAHQHPDGHFPQRQRSHGFGADLLCCRYEDHDASLPASEWVTQPPLCRPAVHRLDAASLYRLALENAPAGTALTFEEASAHFEDASEHFGSTFLATTLAAGVPVSSDLTRALTGWEPAHETPLEDLQSGDYITTPVSQP